MAKSAGKKASNFIVWIILLLLVVGLAGFGATNFGGSTQSVGSVGDTEIGVNDYARALQNELNALQSQTGQVFPLAQAQAFGIDRRVLQRLVADAALDNETASIGLSVGDEEVGQRIREIPDFRALTDRLIAPRTKRGCVRTAPALVSSKTSSAPKVPAQSCRAPFSAARKPRQHSQTPCLPMHESAAISPGHNWVQAI